MPLMLVLAYLIPRRGRDANLLGKVGLGRAMSPVLPELGLWVSDRPREGPPQAR